MDICQRGFGALLYPCIPTTWTLSPFGYGERYVRGTANKPGQPRRGIYERAHVVALEGVLGRKLQPGMQSNHHCDNRGCIQPQHLYEGTQVQNIQDMRDRKRGWSPFEHGLVGIPRILGPEREREMSRRYAAGGISQTRLAREFGVSQPTASRIIARNTQTE